MNYRILQTALEILAAVVVVPLALRTAWRYIVRGSFR